MKKYYGPQTEKARENFPFLLPSVSLDLIYAITEIKKAAALANKTIKAISPEIAKSIITACNEIMEGKHNEQFVTCSLQGGAGTSINMNVNEVIASRATELLEQSKKIIVVHPNDHVNLHQSTNDVNPSALRIVCIRLAHELVETIDTLVMALEQQSRKHLAVRKLGRTHMQDAVPTTIGEEFSSSAENLERDSKRIIQSVEFLYELNLGGTAIGNKINSSEAFITAVYKTLEEVTDISLKPAKNMMALTSSTTDFCNLSSTIQTLCIDLSKMATDIRFLSSGPLGGIGEIHLPELQAGSSIMPGKVNPVIPETINQLYYFVSGKHLTITQASANAHLELAVMFPVIADAIITSLRVVTTGVTLFTNKCINILTIDEKRCEELLEQSNACATLFTKKLGYDTVAELVKESVKTGKTFHQIIIEKNFVTEEEFQRISTHSSP